MTDAGMSQWLEDAERNNWQMPTAPRWKRLPVIRHIRALCLIEVYTFLGNHGMVVSGRAAWELYGTRRGMEREVIPKKKP